MARCSGGLAVSLPGSAMLGLPGTGSVFGIEELDTLVLPSELRVAANLVTEAVAAANLPLRFIARPEMFTHGALRERLAAELDGIGDHLALSDGQTCRLVPGLRNHLFFYRRSMPGAVQALRGLVACAPETFCQLESQLNGNLAFRMDRAWRSPPLSLARFAQTPRFQPPRELPAFLHPGHAERSAKLSLEAGEDERAAEGGMEAAAGPLLYVPLSEMVLADAVFLRWLAEQMLGAILRGGRRIMLELPPSSGDDEEVGALIAGVLRALGPLGVTFPRVLTRQVMWSTAPPSAERLAGARLLLHPGVDFWRFGEDLWRVLEEVLVVQPSPAAARFTDLMRGWLAGLVPLRAIRPEPPEHRVTVAAVV